MNPLKYLYEREFKDGANYLFYKRIFLAYKHHGEVCNVCKHIQGTAKKGFSRYYCKHLRDNITKQLEKERKKINKYFFDFISLAIRQDAQVRF